MYVKVCEFPSIIQQEYDLVFNLKSLFDHVHWLEYTLLCAHCCVLVCGAYIDWAAQQGASIQSFVDDPVKVSRGAAELVHLRHAARKVLKPFCGASARQSLVGSIQPGTMEKRFALTSAAEALKNLASRGFFWNHTWRTPSPGVHSRIHCPQQNGQTSARRLWQATCHQSPRLPTRRTARTARQER